MALRLFHRSRLQGLDEARLYINHRKQLVVRRPEVFDDALHPGNVHFTLLNFFVLALPDLLELFGLELQRLNLVLQSVNLTIILFELVGSIFVECDESLGILNLSLANFASSLELVDLARLVVQTLL